MGQEEGNLLGYSLGHDDSLSLGLEFSWGSLPFLGHQSLKCLRVLLPALYEACRRRSLPSLPSSLKPTHIFYLLILLPLICKENRVLAKTPKNMIQSGGPSIGLSNPSFIHFSFFLSIPSFNIPFLGQVGCGNYSCIHPPVSTTW